MDLKLEVVPVPVSDVDAAKAFYTERVGFNLDHDISPGGGMRVVQMTPPGSACSVVIGEGLPLGEPGSVKGVQLVVEDIEAVREALASRGVEVGEVQQLGPEGSPGAARARPVDHCRGAGGPDDDRRCSRPPRYLDVGPVCGLAGSPPGSTGCTQHDPRDAP